jgi:uncharacterized protein (DUF58 family)
VRLRLNRNGVGLLFLIFSMAYAGFSQSNTAAWLLAFLTLSLALVSLVHTWRNLHGLTIGSEPLEPVFAGELLPARLRLRQMSGRRTLALHLRSPQGGAATRVPEVRPGESPRAEISLPAPLRGHFPAFTVRASSLFPLGFFTASCLVTLPQAHFVYPRPEGDRPLPLDPAVSSGSPSGSHPDGDDFAGVRDWRMGESMRHIDWKAAARSDRLMAKQWHGGEATRLLLSWESLEGVETEARLRQLAQWVVQAARLEAQYELRLPGLPPVGPGRDEAHFHACLRALAGWSPDSV